MATTHQGVFNRGQRRLLMLKCIARLTYFVMKTQLKEYEELGNCGHG